MPFTVLLQIGRIVTDTILAAKFESNGCGGINHFLIFIARMIIREPLVGEVEFIEENCARLPKAHELCGGRWPRLGITFGISA